MYCMKVGWNKLCAAGDSGVQYSTTLTPVPVSFLSGFEEAELREL